MECKIGEIVEYNGEWYQCVEQPNYIDVACKVCSFSGMGNCKLDRCSGTYRSDKTSVIFRKLKKVGEPYTNYYPSGRVIRFQRYKLFNKLYFHNTGYTMCDFNEDGIVSIEIKQNKEDREEKKQKLDKLVDDYMAYRIQYAEFDKELKALYDKEENKPLLKEFDLEAAKAGKPVCTRDGRKARIICFDANIMPGNKNILALIRKDTGSEYVEYYTSNGKFSDSKDDINDLMMLPEKKSVWVNIDKGDSGKITISSPYSTKEEAIHNDNETTIDTIKIYWEE